MKLNDLVSDLVSRVDPETNSFLQEPPLKRILLVVVTADRGLCGAFNTNLIREAELKIKSYKEAEVFVYPIGRKGAEFFRKRNYTIFDRKINFFNHLSFADATEIVGNCRKAFLDSRFDRIEVLYNEFKSAIRQEIQTERVLPILKAEEDQAATSSRSQVDYLYEPSKELILKTILPKQLNIQMWKVLLESNASEQGARMTAMESATDNAEELIESLTLHYNRARQAAITKEISEIVGGAEALKEN